MADGLQKTELALVRTRNRAVLPVLEAGLKSHSGLTRATAIRASVRRTDRLSHTQLLHHIPKLDASDRAVLAESHRAVPHHAAPVLKTAILEGDAEQCKNACQFVELCQDYQQFPTLVKAAENPLNRHPSAIAASILSLATALHDQVLAWSDSTDQAGHDPSFDRHHALTALERSLGSYRQHPRPEIIDAFLMLSPSDSPTLLRILHDLSHPCHLELIAALVSSPRPTVWERLVAMLRDTDARVAALEVVANRSDPPFVKYLLGALRHPVPLRVLHNMQRLRSILWLDNNRQALLEFDGRAQQVAVELAMASSISRDSQFGLIKLLLQDGLVEGRRASCQALARFEGHEADALVIQSLNDPDGAVHATALRQLRPRKLPNALQMLVSKLSSPSPEVRNAACSSLAEFNFVRYRAMYDLLDEHAAHTTGVLVRQVDPTSREKLIADLTCPSVSTRLRAIEMAMAMIAVSDVSEQLVELTRNEHPALREEAVTALAFGSGPAVTAALERAMGDSHHGVADAAAKSLAKIRGTPVAQTA